jgi:Holliday junction DNA helicase RuvA
MIAGLRGRIVSKSADALLIEVSGVIYRVGTTSTTVDLAGEDGSELQLHTHLFVREDQLALYGFATRDELVLFETLLGVSGVGPRLACAILSRLPPDQLQAAITSESVEVLSSVPGVGRRTASRLILDLRGKLPDTEFAPSKAAERPGDADVLSALRSLGYTNAEAREAMAKIVDVGDDSIEARVIAALRHLSDG